MKTICWNARGLGNPRAFRALKNLVQTRNPQILFISETKCDGRVTDRIKNACKFEGCFTVNSSGAKGGLCLLWKEKEMVSITSFSNNHIDCAVKWNGINWRFTGLYGFPEKGQKSLTWDLIRRLNTTGNEPWLIGGDLNEILSNEEKYGGPMRDRKCIDDFRNCIDPSDIFTWHGNRRGIHIKERLDRYLCNPNFDSLFHYAGTRNLDWLFSDHKPIEIVLDNQKQNQKKKGVPISLDLKNYGPSMRNVRI